LPIVALPLSPPLEPQLALTRKALPEGDLAYEEKLDGFRCIAFVDGADVTLQSRNGKDLGRYFPEIVLPPGRYVVDGELVIATGSSFDSLSQRIHPARSRIERLAAETPARFVLFDLLASDDESLLEEPWSVRRQRLEALASALGLLTSTVVTEPSETAAWLSGSEGVIAKDRSAPYLPGRRKGFYKIKRVRTLDAVAVGWREGKVAGTLGALILGLYDDAGRLHVVGHSSGFTAAEKRELPARLAPLETGRTVEGEPSRWQSARDTAFHELRPELVVEVSFDHTSDGRIRHGTTLERFRDDRDPGSCRLAQLDG
jgi:ATP-dependent DNA ligase